MGYGTKIANDSKSELTLIIKPACVYLATESFDKCVSSTTFNHRDVLSLELGVRIKI